MRFYRSDLVKMGGTATVTSLAFLIFNFFLPRSVAYKFAKSERISWDTADSLRKEYREYRPLKVRVHYQDSSDPNAEVDSILNGFKFNASDLNEIINSNLSLPVGEKADEVIFYLGKKGVSGRWPNKYATMHIIAVGVKNDSLLFNRNQTNVKAASSVFDKADPCPPNCPK